jgi:hypothetical protein
MFSASINSGKETSYMKKAGCGNQIRMFRNEIVTKTSPIPS